MDARGERWLLISGGLCGIAWPLLSELLFFALYPLLMGGPRPLQASGEDVVMTQLAEAGRRSAVLALEWGRVGFQLLLLPFVLALFRSLQLRNQSNVAAIALVLGLVSMILAVVSHTFTPTIGHSLAQSYGEASTASEGAAILSVMRGLLRWRGGLNQTACLIYQGSVLLFSISLIRARRWTPWGWAGVVGAVLALPAKLPLAMQVPTNVVWTGLAYFVWPMALGVCLIRGRNGSGRVAP